MLISSVSLFKAAEPKLTENAMVLYGLAYIFYNLCLPPTFPYPDPKSFAAIRIPLLRSLLGGNHPRHAKRLHEIYG
jgi:hypothetical protein